MAKLMSNEEFLQFGEEWREKLGVKINNDIETPKVADSELECTYGGLFQFSDPTNIFALASKGSCVEMTLEDAKKLGKTQFKAVLEGAYKVSFNGIDMSDLLKTADKYRKDPESVKKWPRYFIYAHKVKPAPKSAAPLTAEEIDNGAWDENGVFTIALKTPFCYLACNILNEFPKIGTIKTKMRFILIGMPYSDSCKPKFFYNPDNTTRSFEITVNDVTYAMYYHQCWEFAAKLSDIEVLEYKCVPTSDGTCAVEVVAELILQ